MRKFEVLYQAAGVGSGKVVSMDVYKPEVSGLKPKDEEQSCVLTEIGSTGRYYGSFIADAPDWSVLVTDDGGGNSAKQFGADIYGAAGIPEVVILIGNVQTAINNVASAVSTLQTAVNAVNGKIDIVDTNIDGIVTSVSALSILLSTVNGKIDIVDTNVDGIATGVAGITTQLTGIENKIDDLDAPAMIG